jgi:hypothetical protein
VVRDEHKVRIYKEYFLPANCFILSIHGLTKTDLKKLDDLMHRYLKFWLGMYVVGNAPEWLLLAKTFWARYGCEECLASLTRRKSINGHRFPMPHLSRRGNKRIEMGHRPRRWRSSLISSHMDVHSVRPSVRPYVRPSVRTYLPPRF